MLLNYSKVVLKSLLNSQYGQRKEKGVFEGLQGEILSPNLDIFKG